MPRWRPKRLQQIARDRDSALSAALASEPRSNRMAPSCDRRDHRKIDFPDWLAQHQRPQQKQVETARWIAGRWHSPRWSIYSPARRGSASPRKRGRSGGCARGMPDKRIPGARRAAADRATAAAIPERKPATAQLESEQALIAAPPVENRIAAAKMPRRFLRCLTICPAIFKVTLALRLPYM